MKKTILTVLTLTLVACSENTPEHGDHHAGTMDEMVSGIMVSDARVMPPFPGRDVAASYFTLTNNGPADQLIAVKAPGISQRVEIHNHVNEDGVMKMRRVTAVDIPANGSLEFKPGSYHVMMFESDVPDTLDDVSVTLEFVNADPITLIVDIEREDETDTDDHEGH